MTKPASNPTTVLIVPGLYDSGPDHWQTHWQKENPPYHRIQQKEWAAPKCADWVETIECAVVDHGENCILVGHSSGSIAIVHWGLQTRMRVRGALLVAPSDAEAVSYPAGPTGFDPVPLQRLPFRSTVIASTNDKYVSLERARAFADAWGSQLVELGPHGHISTADGFGRWPDGQVFLQELLLGS